MEKRNRIDGMELHNQGETRVYLTSVKGTVFTIEAYSENGLRARDFDIEELKLLIGSHTIELENVSGLGPSGDIVFRGGLTYSDYTPGVKRFLCLAEIRGGKSGILYVIVNRYGECQLVDRNNFDLLTSTGLMDNYLVDEYGVLKKMPNQRVTQFEAVEETLDTHWGMTGPELSEVLKKNGFTLGYTSSVYSIYSDYYKAEEKYKDHCWYDKNGAVIWYSQYYGTDHYRRPDGDPFYCGCNLIIDGVLECGMEAASQCGVTDFGVVSYSGKGHQRLNFDARQGVMNKYKNLLKVYKPNNPWDFSTPAINLMNSYFRDLTSKQDIEKFRKLALKIGNIPEEEQSSSIYLYGLYSLIGTKRTIDKFTGGLKDIFADYDSNYNTYLYEEIGSEVTFGSATVEQVEQFLNAVGVKIDVPVKVLANKTKEDYKKRLEEQREENKQKSLEQALAEREERIKRKEKMKEASKGLKGMFNAFNKK